MFDCLVLLGGTGALDPGSLVLTPVMIPRSTIFLAGVSFLALISTCIFLAPDFTKGVVKSYASKVKLLLLLPTGWLVYTFNKAGWDIFIYPFYFDPLHHLPQAPQHSLRDRFTVEPEGPSQGLWTNTVKHNGLIRYFGRVNGIRILVTSPQGCDEVLQTKAIHFPKQPATSKILRMWLGSGTVLSSVDGLGHNELRKRLLPAFYARRIKELHPIFWRKGVQMCEVLHDHIASNNGKVVEVNLDDLIDRAALDVVGLAGHGVDFDSLYNPAGSLGKLHKEAFDLGKKEMQVVLTALFLPHWFFVNLPFKVYRDNREGVKALRNHCRKAIRDMIIPKTATEKNVVGMASEMDKFSEDDLVDLSMDLLVAGHKTISSALQTGFYTLAHHPEVQSRLREEIRAAIPDITSPSALEVNLEKDLPYLNAVLNELLRLYPPLASMHRLSSGAVEISGQLIPSGTSVVVSPWAMNRSTAIWGEDAEQFRPERWLENTSNVPLLTFSKGPRNCIGEGFARKEFAALVGAMLARFELSPPADAEGDEKWVKPGITLHVKGGCKVGVREIP